jgi:hypothetical protein
MPCLCVPHRNLPARADNRLVAGSSPPGPTTQSCANPEFPVSAEHSRRARATASSGTGFRFGHQCRPSCAAACRRCGGIPAPGNSGSPEHSSDLSGRRLGSWPGLAEQTFARMPIVLFQVAARRSKRRSSKRVLDQLSRPAELLRPAPEHRNADRGTISSKQTLSSAVGQDVRLGVGRASLYA